MKDRLKVLLKSNKELRDEIIKNIDKSISKLILNPTSINLDHLVILQISLKAQLSSECSALKLISPKLRIYEDNQAFANKGVHKRTIELPNKG